MARCSPVCDEHDRLSRWDFGCTDIDDAKRIEGRLQKENAAQREEIDNTSMFDGIVGASAPLTAVSRDTQAALLRVLQERQLERVGGTETIDVDVRVIAATNRDLVEAVTSCAFREDLFYRLNVFLLEMPSLRDRKPDIPLLVEYFVHRYARRAGKAFRRVNRRTLEHLQSYPWPGNVRELQNVIVRSVIVCDADDSP